jgi:hypothetical protein
LIQAGASPIASVPAFNLYYGSRVTTLVKTLGEALVNFRSRMTRPIIVSLTLGLMALAGTVSARAAELIMFTQAGCPYCAAFDREVAPIYPKTPVGQLAPLRRVDIYQPIPDDLRFLDVERVTPVFVLVDHGHELGRIRGYSGDANFWGLLENLVAEIKPADDSIHAEAAPISEIAAKP